MTDTPDQKGAGALVSIRAAGDHALLVELSSLKAVLSLQAQLQEAPQQGQRDVVAAAQTVLITADSPESLPSLLTALRTMDLSSPPEARGGSVLVPVVYDGEDLDEVSDLLGLAREAVIAAHTGQIWTAAFIGFAPGFAYLRGEDDRLEVPRHATSRTAVPAGSVALGGQYSAIYPRQSPGGWQLIGRSDAVLWDLDREQPALIRPGDTVRFEAVRAQAALRREGAGVGLDAVRATAETDVPATGLLVRGTGLQSTIQDLGRPGIAALGVSAAGAMDRASLRQANRVVGNAEDAAGVEVLNGGLVLEALSDQVLAVAGAPVPLTITGEPADSLGLGRASAAPRPFTPRTPNVAAPFALLAGERLTLGQPTSGLRSYLAVRGGLGGPAVLGSRSTDTMSGIGPQILAVGSQLEVLPIVSGQSVGFPEVPLRGTPGSQIVTLRVVPGPREDWFSGRAWQDLLEQDWTVTPQSNRIGIRLSGRPLERIRPGELASEGTVRGALQVSPSGQPTLFLADHPVTGGYPVIAVVVEADLDRAAQLRPGESIRFVPVAAPVEFKPSDVGLIDVSTRTVKHSRGSHHDHNFA
ncbi:carboxyltransferase domain-containing protein [Psychromicrobium xiongbiense]|uniref:5-oxoprolinase subunit B/C family protein n=1 Tax=Psychromicrobium xiongbiense TaxID=3051184 RepID=UPI002553E4BE|nr:carboxyltransferase domain-containing protein [Psychromicrobium sp. YIM S02556]